ncbi:MAG: chloramphenicol acetyltransferase [Sneathiella sp.]
MAPEQIDIDTWDRREQYLLFRGMEIPHFSLTAPVEITPLVEKARKDKRSLFNAVLYGIMRTVNDIPEFRTRFRGETVLRHPVVHPSFTVPIANDHFGFCEARYIDDWPEFDAEVTAAKEKAGRQPALSEEIEGQDQWIYLSCMPWLDFTAATHPLQNRDDCIPRIAWGKIVEEDGRARVSVNLQAHHALMDGLHAARFYEGLQENLLKF